MTDEHKPVVQQWDNEFVVRQLTAGKDVSIEAEDIVGIHYQATTGADIAK
jgi:FKBP-type peptidyl-prolyl cis-trans isomerase